MFILNDVNLSNYGRGRDRTKRKSRGNLLRNAAIGVGGLAVAGGLGYLALRGKVKPSISKPPVTTVTKPPLTVKPPQTTRVPEYEPKAKSLEEINNMVKDNYQEQMTRKSKVQVRKDAMQWRVDGTKNEMDALKAAKQNYKDLKAKPAGHLNYRLTKEEVRSGNITQDARDNYIRRKRSAKQRGKEYARKLAQAKPNIKQAQANLRNKSRQLGLFYYGRVLNNF